MPVISTVGPAVTYLLQAFKGHPQLGGAGVDIVNSVSAYVEGGPVPGDTSADSAIWVGWSSNPLVESAIDMLSSPPSLGGQRDREQYVIHCNAAHIDHNADVGNTARAQAFALSLYAVAREIISLNRNLGGLQGIAKISRGAVTSKATADGPRVDVEFDVEVDAFQTYQP